ncbi:MAG: hypothetical protein O7B99_07165 [Planctomycetota bacterium]|nr:hypothetical protein [Planctomycetota bacterium]
MPALASAQVVADFDTYSIHRVGMMPFEGVALSVDHAAALEQAFFTEISRSTPFELVALDARDLEEVRASEPYRRGWYRPETIIALSRRYSLDAILFPTATQVQFFPPQKFSAQLDLVVAETGLVIWSSAVHLDANDPHVREGLEAYYGSVDEEWEGQQDWRVALLSPARFAQFAAYQVALLL